MLMPFGDRHFVMSIDLLKELVRRLRQFLKGPIVKFKPFMPL